MRTSQTLRLASLFILAIAGGSEAQRTPDPASCSILTTSTLCGSDYVGWPIYNVTSEQFNTALQSLAVETRQMEALLKTSTGCLASTPASVSTEAITSLRYQVSVWCSAAVLDALNIFQCKPPSPEAADPTAVASGVQPSILCAKHCSAATSSIQLFFANQTLCPTSSNINTPVITKRIGSFTDYCERTAQMPQDKCIKGAAMEATTCGFLAQNKNAERLCEPLTNDDCCNALLNRSTGKKSNIGATIGIIFAIILIVAGLIGGLMYWRRRKQRLQLRQKEESNGFGYGYSDKYTGRGGGGGSRKGPDNYNLQTDSPTIENPWHAPLDANNRHNNNPHHDSNGYYNDMHHSEHRGGEYDNKERHLYPPSSAESISMSPIPAMRYSLDRNAGAAAPKGGLAQPRTGNEPRRAKSVTFKDRVAVQNEDSFAQEISFDVAESDFGASTSVNGLAHMSELQNGGPLEDAGNNGPLENVVMRVLHPYDPTMEDELPLIAGTEIVMVRAFDDGWALGAIPATGQQGAFPLVCVAHVDEVPDHIWHDLVASSTQGPQYQPAPLSPTALSPAPNNNYRIPQDINKRVSSQRFSKVDLSRLSLATLGKTSGAQRNPHHDSNNPWAPQQTSTPVSTPHTQSPFHSQQQQSSVPNPPPTQNQFFTIGSEDEPEFVPPPQQQQQQSKPQPTAPPRARVPPPHQEHQTSSSPPLQNPFSTPFDNAQDATITYPNTNRPRDPSLLPELDLSMSRLDITFDANNNRR
ncbi:hypothetical protein DFS34DRAFT_597299 [Phlyctochytrium arcticum]|nr:hypothetical protein DFS34DRAFT_597299 [Phlyctochytrium arcticum]